MADDSNPFLKYVSPSQANSATAPVSSSTEPSEPNPFTKYVNPSQQNATPPQPISGSDVAAGVGSGLVKGALDIPAMPSNIWHIIDRAYQNGLTRGAQALGFAEITGDTGSGWMENVGSNDYGNRQNIGYGRKFGLLKPQYKSKYDSNTREDFGTVAIKTAAAAN